jgi:hypothetical protein
VYDVLRAAYRFGCPHRPPDVRETVVLSGFRRVERLAGAARPALFRVEYRCGCGEDHVGLVAEGDLDYAPLGAASAVEFRNLMTGRVEPVAVEIAEIVRAEVGRGNWPWRLYCAAEARVRPVFPSALALVAPGGRDGAVGVAMRCPGCGAVSINLVTRAHLDVPFYHDRVVRYLARPFVDAREVTVERFHDELHSGRFDAERAELE